MTTAVRHARVELAAVPAGPYRDAAEVLLAESGCKIRAWRKSLSGVAHCTSPDWEITVPMPTTALRFSVFAHEVGHQMLHRHSTLPRYVEEVQAWEYALDAFARLDLHHAGVARSRARRGIRYAFKKALRRGVSAATIKANPDPDVRWWAVDIDVYQLAEDLRNGGAS